MRLMSPCAFCPVGRGSTLQVGRRQPLTFGASGPGCHTEEGSGWRTAVLPTTGGPEGHVDAGSRCSGLASLAFLASETLGGCTAPLPLPRAFNCGGRPIVPAFLRLYPEVMVRIPAWAALHLDTPCTLRIPLSMKVRGLPCSSFKGNVLFPHSHPQLRSQHHSDPLQALGPRDTPLQLGPSSGIQAGRVS